MTISEPEIRTIQERKDRLALLQASHIVPLTEYVHRLRSSLGDELEIPYFDPLDGGINATMLFLLEAPGPSVDGGSKPVGHCSEFETNE